MQDGAITNFIIDDEATEIDLLGRGDFARNLASIIINAPDRSSFRIGVYGEWGEGKTSVLKMVANALKMAEIDAVPFVPWAYKTPDELVENLIVTIVRELDLHAGKNIEGDANTLSTVTELGRVASEILKSVKDIHWTTKILSPIVDRVVNNKDSLIKEWKDKGLLNAIIERLSKKKLVILIDDLDRVRGSGISCIDDADLHRTDFRFPTRDKPLVLLSAGK